MTVAQQTDMLTVIMKASDENYLHKSSAAARRFYMNTVDR